ncbi:ATP-binding cassette domain-containing protein [Pantoea sp. 1.19]|uniref:ATP-binding cassette domain-containing protein n=1 Tax=Pantoea sp. 1.19 TaxID=1925589 RepID=UPI000948CECA|nr:ATP-binding cassette domain-containing protein [Pantoea sp. 1.19]
MLRLRAVNQYYGQHHILWDVDLDLTPGSCTAIVGRSGMGKTTLVNCIMGHLPVNSGSVEWLADGGQVQNLLAHPSSQRAALGMGYMPQVRQVFSQLTVEENLHIALMAGQPDRHKAIPATVYDLFPTLWSRRHQRAGELTRGDQQQLALARALVLEPKLLLLDEPAEGMTPWLEEEMGNLLHRLNHDFGLTILLLEQRISLIRRVAQHFCLLHRGRNVAQGSVNQLDDAMLASWRIAV